MATLTAPLDTVLGSTSKVRILRLLVSQARRTVSARERARLTTMGLPAVLNALDDLVAQRVAHRERVGRQFLCRVNRRHVLVRRVLAPLFAAEWAWTDALLGAVAAALLPPAPPQSRDRGRRTRRPPAGHPPLLAAAVYGSTARGEDTPASDLDVFVVARTAADIEAMQTHIATVAPTLEATFGLRLSPVIMTLARARERLAARDPLLVALLRDARALPGIPDVADVVRD